MPLTSAENGCVWVGSFPCGMIHYIVLVTLFVNYIMFQLGYFCQNTQYMVEFYTKFFSVGSDLA